MKLDGLDNAALLAMQEGICSDPACRAPAGGVYLYKPAARKRLDAIRLQITHNLAEGRAASGRPVSAGGYSGRGCNRRR